MKTIPLTRGKEAIVDDEDYGWLSQWGWYLMANSEIEGYAHYQPKKHGPFYYMHRLIAKLMYDIPEGYEVDHINGNSLDNRRANIRIVTPAQNNMNAKKRKGCSSKYKGVSWKEPRQKWYAYHFMNGKQYHLGVFDSEIKAAKAYDEAAKKHYGKFARLNFPEQKEAGI